MLIHPYIEENISIYDMRLEINPGDQYIIPPNTWHWFQAGPKGAMVWSISSRVTDVQDQFRDPRVVRKTIIVDN